MSSSSTTKLIRSARMFSSGKSQKRNLANRRERKRMRLINQAFGLLKSKLSHINHDHDQSIIEKNLNKLTKVDILRQTISYIKQLRSQIPDNKALLIEKDLCDSSLPGHLDFKKVKQTIPPENIDAKCRNIKTKSIDLLESNKDTDKVLNRMKPMNEVYLESQLYIGYQLYSVVYKLTCSNNKDNNLIITSRVWMPSVVSEWT